MCGYWWVPHSDLLTGGPEKKEEANGKAVVLHLYHYLRPEEKFEDVEELKCQIEEDIWEGKRHFLLTMESRRALLESETKKQKKN